LIIVDAFPCEPQKLRIKVPLASRKTKWALRSGYTLGIGLFIYLLRAPLLVGIAEAWVVRQNIEKADAILVLGGGLQTRPFEAARLYHKGYAPKVLVADTNLSPTDILGVTVSETEAVEQILLKNAVPPNAIIKIGKPVSNTYEEARALRDWVEANAAHKVIVPTELFHTRRVSWVFHKMLKGTGAEIRVQSLNPRPCTTINWWQREQCLVDFHREVIKFAYYVIKY
jgi:uncharacterized SAM-binding protein YcdF (DUF218 family)